MAARSRRKRKGMTTPNPKVNEVQGVGPRDPSTWGGPDPLPGGKSRAISKSTVLRMFEQKALDSDQLSAAVEIEKIFMLVAGALFARGQNYERVGGGMPSTSPDWAIRAYRDRYLPWCAEMKRYTYGPETNLAYAIRIIIDGHSLHQMDEENRWKKGTASQLIKEALSSYVKLVVATSAGGRYRKTG